MSTRTFTHIDVPFVNNLAKEILNSLAEVNNKFTKQVELDTSLYSRKTLDFRAIIDNTFPTILIVDYKDIEKELLKYKDIDSAISLEISDTAKLPSKSLTHLSNKQVSNIISAIRSGITRLSNAKSITEIEFTNSLSSIFADPLVNQGRALALFKQKYPGTYKLATNSVNRDFYLFPNFSQVRDQLNKYINLAIESTVEIEGTSSIGIENIGKALAYGHTGVGNSTDIYVNTPKIVAIILDSISNSSKTNSLNVLDMFLTNTMQIETYVDISKDFNSTGAISQFIRLGGNIVKYENTVINSLRGTHQEKTGNVATNKKVLSHLSKLFEKLNDSYSNTIRRSLNKFIISRDSPSMLDYITIEVMNSLEGVSNKQGSFKLNKSIKKVGIPTNKSVPKKTLPVKSTKLNLPKAPPIRTNQGQFYSLTSLQGLINQHLQSVISANMGDEGYPGGQRKILNYRTGRFAASAQVERMSQSREGMITAFYSYMKNPYQVFEPGHKMGNPLTRDPKLLISSSIREIAATKVGNRLRAVSV